MRQDGGSILYACFKVYILTGGQPSRGSGPAAQTGYGSRLHFSYPASVLASVGQVGGCAALGVTRERAVESSRWRVGGECL